MKEIKATIEKLKKLSMKYAKKADKHQALKEYDDMNYCISLIISINEECDVLYKSIKIINNNQ